MFELTLREKILIILMILIMAGGGIWVYLKKFDRTDTALQPKIEKTYSDLKKIRSLKAELRDINRMPQLPIIQQSLTSFIEKAARRFKIHEQLQLNAISTKLPKGFDGIQVKFDRLNLDQLFEIYYFLENNKPVVLIDHIEVSMAPGSDLLKTSFRVYKQKKL